MAILSAAHRVLAVVQMNRPKPRQAEHAVKLAEHIVKPPNHVIASVVHMAGIQTHADPISVARCVHDLAQFLKAAPDLASLARHGFQQNRRGRPLRHDRIQHVRDVANADLHALPDMAARMKVEHRAGDMRKALQILPHGAHGKFSDGRIRRAGVERIRRMRENRREPMRRKEVVQRVRILPIKRLDAAAARIARKELKRVRAEGERLFAHRQIALGAGQMTADMQHVTFPPPRPLHPAWPSSTPACRRAAQSPFGAARRGHAAGC